MADGAWNSAPAFTGASLDSLREAIGTPQFTGPNGTDWFLVFNGMILQGGALAITTTPQTIPMATAFTLQVLGIFAQCDDSNPVGVSNATLSSFDVTHSGGGAHSGWWIAIGV